MNELGLRDCGDNPDDKSDKSQWCVILTSPGQRRLVQVRLAAIEEKSQAAAQKAREKEEKKQRAKNKRETKAGKSGSRRKKPNEKEKAHLLRESKTTRAVDAQDVCTRCEAKWSVFEKYADQYTLSFRGCSHCSKHWCGFCMTSDDAMANVHEPMCKEALEKQAEFTKQRTDLLVV